MQVDKGHTGVHVPGRREGSSHLNPCAPIPFSPFCCQAGYLTINRSTSQCIHMYLLSKVNSSGFSIGYIAEVTHGNPRFRFKLCDLNKVLG